MTTVPRSIIGPETVTIFAFVIAYDCASAEAASRLVAAKASKANLSFIKVNSACKPGLWFTERINEKFRKGKERRGWE